MEENGWLIDKPAPAVDYLCHLDEGALQRAAFCLGDRMAHRLARGRRLSEVALESRFIEPQIPDLKRRHLGELVHVVAVRSNHTAHDIGSLRRGERSVSTGQLQARGETLDVPLPRRRQR